MKKIFFKKKLSFCILSAILFFLITINCIYFYLNLNADQNSYAFNELFVNYQAGFIRRGFLGEIVWQLNKHFNVNPNVFFSNLFFIIYLGQIFLFYNLIKKFSQFKTIFILILLSPSILLFHIYSPNLFFLKDSIIKFVFLLHAFIFYKFYILEKNAQKYFNYLKFLIIPILFLIILTHEYQVFSLSLHFLITLGTARGSIDLKKIIKYYSTLLIPIMLIVIFFGNQTQFNNLSEILEQFNIVLNPYLGGGLYHYIGGFYKWHFFYFTYTDFVNLFLSFILSILIFYVLFSILIEKKIISFYSKYQKEYLFYFFPILIPFLLTSDHGRNISFASFYLVVFYLILNLNKTLLIRKTDIFYQNILNKSLVLVFIFFYIFMWKLDQVAGFGLQGKPNGIFKSSLFAEIVKFVKFLYIYVDLNIIDLPEIRL